VAPGGVVGLWLRESPSQAYVLAHGDRRLTPSLLPMLPDTVFDLASLSKVLGTWALTARLIDRGWIRWTDRVKSFFPEYPHADIELRHLLAHTAGFPAWEPLWQRIRDRFTGVPLQNVGIRKRQALMRELVLSIRPEVPVDTRALYSDITFLLLGFVLEEVTGLPLDQAVRRWVWGPMGLSTATYHRTDQSPREGMIEEAAATENCPWRGAVLQGQVHDDNCWAMGGYGGHAGAFGTIRDVLQFARALFEGFYSRETLRASWTRVDRPAGCERTLGWDTPSGPESSAGPLFSPSSVGHLGFTGTSLWIDPAAGVAVALLTNRVHPDRENIRIRQLRPKIHESIRLDLGR